MSKAWRRTERQRLRALAATLSPDWVAEGSAVIAQRLEKCLPGLGTGCFGFTWPMPGEPDLRAAAARWVADGGEASLPEIVKGQPLTFRPWRPDAPMRDGAWGIPVPDTDIEVLPEILLIPCPGYDQAGYRMGYGGGFYDRTLAARRPRPLAVGVGWSHAIMPTIRPEPYDIPMDLIVTEQSVRHGRKQVNNVDISNDGRHIFTASCAGETPIARKDGGVAQR